MSLFGKSRSEKDAVQKTVTTVQGDPFRVAIDNGRSSLKMCYQVPNGTDLTSFPFLVSRVSSMVERLGLLQAFSGKSGSSLYFPLIATLNVPDQGDVLLAFGDTARAMSPLPIQEGKPFLTYSCLTILFSIACAIRLNDSHEKLNVCLCINLTNNDYHLAPEYAAFLKGEHAIKFSDGYETHFIVNPDKFYVLYQGFSGFLSVAMNPDVTAKKEFISSSGVVLDPGRQTLDCLYVDSMMPKKDKYISYRFGTYSVYNEVRAFLTSEKSVVKEVHEIEDLHVNNKVIPSMDGKHDVMVQDYVDKAVASLFPQFCDYFLSFIADSTPSFICLIGGGSRLFFPKFKEKYPIAFMPKDPENANVLGMMVYLRRIVR